MIEHHQYQPRTQAAREALKQSPGMATISDLLFLEAWETHRPTDLGTILRAGQIRRANAGLADAIRAELTSSS